MLSSSLVATMTLRQPAFLCQRKIPGGTMHRPPVQRLSWLTDVRFSLRAGGASCYRSATTAIQRGQEHGQAVHLRHPPSTQRRDNHGHHRGGAGLREPTVKVTHWKGKGWIVITTRGGRRSFKSCPSEDHARATADAILNGVASGKLSTTHERPQTIGQLLDTQRQVEMEKPGRDRTRTNPKIPPGGGQVQPLARR